MAELTLTDIGIGAAPNDGTGDPPRTAGTSINANNAAIETAVNTLQGRYWTVQNTSTTAALGDRLMANSHAGITITMPATFAGSAVDYGDLWVCNADDASNVTLTPASGDAFFVDGATHGIDTTYALTPGNLAILSPRTTDSEWDLVLVGGGATGGWSSMSDAVWAGGTQSEVADGASAVAFDFTTDVSYVTSGAKLMSVKNNGTEEFFISYNGTVDLKGNEMTTVGAITCATPDAMHRSISNGSLIYSGGSGSTDGANLVLYGSTHATDASDVQLRQGSNVVLHYDHSNNYWHFQNKTIVSGNGEFRSGVADGASAVAYNYDTINSLANGSAKLMSVKNNATEKWSVAFDGQAVHTVANTATSGGVAPLKIDTTYNQASGTAANTDLLVNRTETAIGSGEQLLLDLQRGGVSQFKIDRGGLVYSLSGGFNSQAPDGASTQAFNFNTVNTLSTSGAALLTLNNNNVKVFDFSFEGGINHANSGASTAAHRQSLNLNWGASSAQTSSGPYSAVIGYQNTASGARSMAFGRLLTVSGNDAAAVGYNNTVAAINSFVCGATHNIASGSDQSFAAGNRQTINAENAAAFGASSVVEASHSTSITIGASHFSSLGDAQVETLVIKKATTDATQTTLVNRVSNAPVIPADTTWAFSALIVARSDEADGNEQAGWEIKGVLGRDELNNTAMVGTPVVTQLAASANAIADGWSVDCVADDINEALSIRVVGAAATNIRWVAKVDISQVTFA